jgi:SulP family sulfate permease
VKWLPPWVRTYKAVRLPGDLTAGLIVTALLIPQSLAYAMLAGLPLQVGLYASILPLVAYAALGSSMTLAVGPVAVLSLMTASALQPLAAPGSPEYIALAVQLALLSGAMLLVFGALRLGFLAQFLSQPVVAGFIAGSALLIAYSQLRHVVGSPTTTAIGVGTIAYLLAARRYIPGLLGKLAPMVAVIVATLLTGALHLDTQAGVPIVGTVPEGLPALSRVVPGWDAVSALWLPALLISLVGFVESVSVARSLALKRAERIVPDRELLGLGAANVASALSGGFPVTGGFARSVVNFAAGANTPLAGIVSALLMAVVLAGLTGWFFYLPIAVLAATIIVAVLSLVDWTALRDAWRYDRSDALAFVATMGGVLVLGVEEGVVLGVALSLATLVWHASRPHIAVVGRIAGTEHFRNVERHAVETLPGLVAMRIDESLFFGNAAAVEERIERVLAEAPGAKRLLLILSAVNRIDATALGMLTELEQDLERRGVTLYLAEVKGPVMDRLAAAPFGARIKGRTFLSAHSAFQALQPARG